MPRKSNGSATPSSRKRKNTSAPESLPNPIQEASGVRTNGHSTDVSEPNEVVSPTVLNPTNLRMMTATGGQNGANLDEEIRHRAYELYLQRNGQGGDENGDWLSAEREVRARHAVAGHSA